MSLDQLFSLAGLLALTGWIALVLTPLAPRLIDPLAGLAIPLLLALGYAALVVVHWGGAPGGFGSLDTVATLFQSRPILLAGWVHYLAFDLFVGGWIVRRARRDGLPHWLAVLALPPTFLFGPTGLLAFVALRGLWRGRPTLAEGAAR
ncbi:ABA4-like family protein [Salinarimonas soli]|uniref:DUF4281 domain-containing protein n=1 Tax=Salinarimonas soli TaxID=1638099 RepID=A0A5B2VHU0_9HYPH|nr:ABA4-like family protein [Salinarimonas soli]KAA2237909.1 DUF4281 domain-containing protein [Salinarimonas soli]